MKVSQIYQLMNSVTSELLGDEVIVNEDLSNVVELGQQFENAVGVDNFVKSLTDHIGKMIFVDRPYSGRAPSVFMDGWEFGSILEKVSTEMPEATENESWELQDGASYDPNIFYKPKVSAEFWNKRVTFEVPISITEKQVKSAFSSVTQLNAFVSMIYTSVDNAMTVKMDALIMRTINNFTAVTINAEYPGAAGLSAGSGVRCVNLLYLYNNKDGAPGANALTADQAIRDPGFIRFAALTMKNYAEYIRVMSTRFNVDGKQRHTPFDRLHWVTLSEFANAADVYLQSDTFHDEFTRLPAAETVPFWQGSGSGFKFADVSAIDVKASNGATIKTSGVLAVMFDTFALGVTNMDRRVTTNYNGKGEFYNQWHKMDAGYFNDTGENFVVFVVA